MPAAGGAPRRIGPIAAGRRLGLPGPVAGHPLPFAGEVGPGPHRADLVARQSALLLSVESFRHL